MKRRSWSRVASFGPVLVILAGWIAVTIVPRLSAQSQTSSRAAARAATGAAAPHVYGTQDGEWQTYGGDLSSTRYSPLDQIDASNFSNLEVAFRIRTDML